MQERHKNRLRYFEEQGVTTRDYVIPYIEDVKKVDRGIRVLEIGCGEGGNLTPFIDRGCEVVGIDLSEQRIENAKRFIADKYPDVDIHLIARDIYKVSMEEVGLFDVVFLRDVIEHIPNQARFMEHLKRFLKPDGVVFFAFPPWTMPFGGHQQVCKSKVLSKLPYFHLLPNFLYVPMLRGFGETQRTIDELLEVKSTGIGINKFVRIVESVDYEFVKKDFYLINPNYKVKFGLTPRLQYGVIKAIPYLRDFFTTCLYSLIRNKPGA